MSTETRDLSGTLADRIAALDEGGPVPDFAAAAAAAAEPTAAALYEQLQAHWASFAKQPADPTGPPSWEELQARHVTEADLWHRLADAAAREGAPAWATLAAHCRGDAEDRAASDIDARIRRVRLQYGDQA